jgi:hypothetical protein
MQCERLETARVEGLATKLQLKLATQSAEAWHRVAKALAAKLGMTPEDLVGVLAPAADSSAERPP